MAMVGALCIAINAVAGFTNRSLRAQVAGFLATNYSSSQMTYDLRRLRRKGLIQRVPRSNTYALTYDGVRVAIFYTRSTSAYCAHCSPLIIPPQYRTPPSAAGHRSPRRCLHRRCPTPIGCMKT